MPKGAFKFNWTHPEPIEARYFLFNYSFEVAGEIAEQDATSGVDISGKEVEFAVERRLSEKVEGKVKTKLDRQGVEGLVSAVKNGSKKEFAAAMLKTLGLELALKEAQFLGSPIDVDVGAEFSKTPVFIKASFKIKETISLPDPVGFEAKLQGGFHLGLSKQGWAAIAKRVGPEALARFFRMAGQAFRLIFMWLLETGVLAIVGYAIGGIAGTFGLLALTTYLVNSARREGALRGVGTWYSSAYCAKLFGRAAPTGYVSVDYMQLARDLARAGQKDAVIDARNASRKAGDPDWATISEQEILKRHRRRLRATYGSDSRADHGLKLELNKLTWKKLGL